MDRPLPLTRDLVLIGGGHTHALVLRRWGMRPLPGARVTLINPEPDAPYTGMLPGHIAGHYDRAALDIDLVRLSRFAGARLVLNRAVGIDREARTVLFKDRPALRYDVLSLDIGITSNMPDLPGFANHGIAAKPLGPFADRWAAFIDTIGEGSGPPYLAVIGGGIAGAELAMAMSHRIWSVCGTRPEITILDTGAGLGGIHPTTARTLRQRMSAMGIALRPHVRICHIDANGLGLIDGTRITSAFTVGAAGARPHDWLADTGLALHDGYVSVDRTLRSVNDPAVFAAGDCAHLSHAPRPKAGVFAVRAAPILLRNLTAALSGGTMHAFHPQATYLKLISLGEKAAIADRGGLSLSGRWAWRLKDRIDRQFMDRFADLPSMAPPKPPSRAADGVAEISARDAPPCAGCGAKMGRESLTAGLTVLPKGHRCDVQTLPGDDAAVLRVGGATQVITTDHLPTFTDDLYLSARIAAIHALGDIWAMGAEPQAALATVLLPPMAPALEQDTLSAILTGASEIFVEAGAQLTGGHTSISTETTIGFTVTGLCPRPPITLTGAQPGDHLILTKPIGSGTILAGEMRLAANGQWVAHALTLMQQSQAQAARILSHAHAMTDVTGFGLAGHLMGMLTASNSAARLDLSAIPLMPGASILAHRGIRSSLFQANRQAIATFEGPQTPEADLLFDPQTAGGLLASVPPMTSQETLLALADAGYEAAIIGAIDTGPPVIRAM